MSARPVVEVQWQCVEATQAICASKYDENKIKKVWKLKVFFCQKLNQKILFVLSNKYKVRQHEFHFHFRNFHNLYDAKFCFRPCREIVSKLAKELYTNWGNKSYPYLFIYLHFFSFFRKLNSILKSLNKHCSLLKFFTEKILQKSTKFHFRPWCSNFYSSIFNLYP